MTEQEKILQGNKIIAEFMELEPEGTMKGKMVYAVPISRNNPEKINDIETEFFYPTELRYHSSWDWLMPVVEKAIHDGRRLKAFDQILKLRFLLGFAQILPVWKALVECIEFYDGLQ